MNRKLPAILVFCMSALAALSQEKDFGIWYGVSGEFEILNRLDATVSTSVRTYDRAVELEEVFLEGEVVYKFNDYLAAAASYRISENIEDDNAFHIRHKWFVHMIGSLPLGDLKITGRIIFQQRFKTYFEDENDKLPTSHARFRVKAQYNFPALPVDPYIYGEFFYPLFKDSERIIDKKRAGGGFTVDITDRHEVQIGYIFQRDYFPDLIDENIVTLGYTLKF
ncbi:MAG: DUF2490 domain-containing protein [Bacteroidota bacterium]